MGDVRFDSAWEEWCAIPRDKRSAFLKGADLATLIALLASTQAGRDAYQRNVIASALSNRLQRLNVPDALPENLAQAQNEFVDAIVAQSSLRSATAREIAIATYEHLRRIGADRQDASDPPQDASLRS